MSDDAPSISRLAGQLSYLFEDHPELRSASDEDVAARLNHDDRFARAREQNPLANDDTIKEKVAELADRITPEMVRAARETL
ncbi:MAG: hypothetical protein FJW86_10860 [Actinobacteria bacterium]|nr:hypothetical protein [Actinomycetota bacterium]